MTLSLSAVNFRAAYAAVNVSGVEMNAIENFRAAYAAVNAAGTA